MNTNTNMKTMQVLTNANEKKKRNQSSENNNAMASIRSIADWILQVTHSVFAGRLSTTNLLFLVQLRLKSGTIFQHVSLYQ